MQDRQGGERVRLPQWPPTRQQRRDRNRENHLVEQQALGRRGARTSFGKPSDLHVEIESTRLNIAFDDAELDGNIGIGERKRRQTPHQPAVGEGGAQSNLESPWPHRCTRAGAQLRHLVKHPPKSLRQGNAGRGRQQTAPRAIEQSRADKALEFPQPMTDRRSV